MIVFFDASVAYQGFGRGLPLNLVHEMNSRSSWNVRPDLTIFLDVEPARGLTRISKRIQELEVPADRIEKESLEFFHKAREGYFYVSQEEPVRYRVLDGSMEIEELHRIILDVVTKELVRRNFKKNLMYGI